MAYSGISKPSLYFNTKLWTGTGDSTTAVTGVGFQPDWVWVKNRDVADDHMLFDAVRGVTKRLFSNSTGAEGTDAQTLTSFDSDGFTTGTNRATGGDSGNKMVAWNWKANGSGSSNTDGNITSTVSANTTAGFSIVKVAKSNTNVATIGHGLGVAPKFIIGKDLDAADNWTCYHASLGNGKGIYLNATNAETSASTFWNSTSPTSSVFTIGSDNTWNSPSILFYCFAEKKGYSKFGSYTGNANADGTFIYTGFKPAFIMAKRTDSSSNGNWIIWDNKRDGYNPNKALFPNSNSAEQAYASENIDILSNGWKQRGSSFGNDGEFIYMAFAAEPLVANVGVNGVPATAR
jgi:hypothetical protein